MNKRGAAGAQGRAGGARLSGRSVPTPSVHKLGKSRVWHVQNIAGCTLALFPFEVDSEILLILCIFPLDVMEWEV